MCLRCSPGLFRHACGVASCHTSSMAAKPHLALTKNSSPTTLANERRAAQNRGVQRQSLWSLRARREIPHRPKAPSADGAIPTALAVRPPSPPRCGWRTTAFSCPPTVGRGIPDAPAPPSGAVKDAGPYVGGRRKYAPAAGAGPALQRSTHCFLQWSCAPFPRRFFLPKNKKSLYPFYIFYSIMTGTNTSGKEPARRIFPCGYTNN